MPEIWFPNLGIEIDHLSRTAFTIFGLDVYWYGIFIGLGIILGTAIAMRYMKKIGGNPDNVLDFMVYAIIFCIIGARLYYVIFSWDLYKDNLMDIFNLRKGGLAIYGGIIAALIFGVFFVRRRKLDFWYMADAMIPSVPLGQAIGRWGNFFNEEAHGGPTDLPWAQIIDGVGYHPTFLYESVWCFLLFIFLMYFSSRRRTFYGQIICLYGILYSVERFFVEGLRTDSLMIGPLRQAQVISLVIIAGCIALYFYLRKTKQIKNRL